MLSPAVAGIKSGLAAIKAGDSTCKNALPPPELRAALGYADYDAASKPYVIG
jgi:hypothetical protein